jgi:hypothetical protein
MADSSAAYHKRQLEVEDLAVAYRARKLVKQERYASNNPEKAKAFSMNAQANAKANKKYYCETCDLACKSDFDLKAHKKTKIHLRNAAQIDVGHSSQIEDLDQASMLEYCLDGKCFCGLLQYPDGLPECSDCLPGMFWLSFPRIEGVDFRSTSRDTFTECSDGCHGTFWQHNIIILDRFGSRSFLGVISYGGTFLSLVSYGWTVLDLAYLHFSRELFLTVYISMLRCGNGKMTGTVLQQATQTILDSIIVYG